MKGGKSTGMISTLKHFNFTLQKLLTLLLVVFMRGILYLGSMIENGWLLSVSRYLGE